MLLMVRVAVVEVTEITVFATTVATVVGAYTFSVELAGKKMFEVLVVFANAIVILDRPAALDTFWITALTLESGRTTLDTRDPGKIGPDTELTPMKAVFEPAEVTMVEDTLIVACGTADTTGLVVGPKVTV